MAESFSEPARTPERSAENRGERPDRGGRNERFREDRPRRPEGSRSEAMRPTPSESRAPARSNDDFSAVWQDSPSAVEPPARALPRPIASAPNELAEAMGSRLYLNLGRKDRVRTDDIVSLLQEAGTPIAAEAIEVMSTHSYINVNDAQANALVEALNGREHNGRSLVCELAKPRRERY